MTDARLACRACGQIHPDARLVALPDGQEVGNYSEAHRRFHEARWVLKRYRVKKTRQGYLERARRARGEDAAHELREEMLKQWQAKA
jgi:hypothetical protein